MRMGLPPRRSRCSWRVKGRRRGTGPRWCGSHRRPVRADEPGNRMRWRLGKPSAIRLALPARSVHRNRSRGSRWNPFASGVVELHRHRGNRRLRVGHDPTPCASICPTSHNPRSHRRNRAWCDGGRFHDDHAEAAHRTRNVMLVVERRRLAVLRQCGNTCPLAASQMRLRTVTPRNVIDRTV